jgi:glycogen operon protein
MTEKYLQKKPHPLGAHREGSGVRFSFVSRTASCGVLLYDRAAGTMLRKIPFTQEDRIGNVYCRVVEDIDPKAVSYLFYQEDRPVADWRARVFPRKVAYGKERRVEDLKAGFLAEDYDWGRDCCPRIPYSQMVGYCMHVRGFTRHASSGVKHRGTFLGIVEKLPYLKEIGVTTVELQPAYEFMEVPLKEERRGKLPFVVCPGEPGRQGGEGLNYWGYKKGYYYMPKGAYAASEDPSGEFKDMVKAFHENGMEVVMQFFFTGVSQTEILEILHFWVLEYHVDGFHLMGENLPVDLLASDDVLADTKLWYYTFDTGRVYGRNEQPRCPHLAEYNDAWYYDMRRFLKGDGGMLGGVLYHMRHIPEKAGCIHYLSNYFGFTLADLVSYDYKHNEANGEDNRDGSDYNCSWNCGEEGPARSQKVRRLRVKQMKNALCFLMLSQSTPLIFMGDEFGNSQKGNNNPYGQDNAVTWLDWNGKKKNAQLLQFWKMLVEFRRAHPILRPSQELRQMDYIACGYPDLSYHGRYAWQPQTEGNYRHVGIMLCGKYARDWGPEGDTFLYLAINMHWESHELALPRLPRGFGWVRVFSTESQGSRDAGEDGAGEAVGKIPPRSLAVYISAPKQEEAQEEEAGSVCGPEELEKERDTVSLPKEETDNTFAGA